MRIIADLFAVVLRQDDIQEFDSKWNEKVRSMTQIQSDEILESLYKLGIRESEKLRTVLELYNLEIHQKKVGPDYRRLKTMTPPNSSPSSSKRQNERNASRTRSLGGKSPSGRKIRLPCKDYLKGTCKNSFCEKWHPPEYLFYKSENGCRFGEKCSYAHRQFEEQPSKRFEKNGDKSAVAMKKKNERHQRIGRPVLDAYSSNTLQLGCGLQDMELAKSGSILRKSSSIRKPIQRVNSLKPS